MRMRRSRAGLVGVALLVALLGPGTYLPAFAAPTDADHDRMPDRWERSHGLNPRRNDARRDPDRDGLSNLREYRIDRTAAFASHPRVADSDHDGVSDGDEDPDHDGLANEDEAALGSRLLDADSDDDGVSDSAEDPDHDGLANAFELGATNADQDEDDDGLVDRRDDDDHDGISNAAEFHPRRTDSDRDGVADAAEDEDGDGLDNDDEEQLGEDPTDADSDDDGETDGEEASGTIVAFDAATRTLTLQPLTGAEVSGVVAEDAELGWDDSGDGPSACEDADDPTLADLLPGRVVSELETDDAAISEIELVCPASIS